MSWDAMRALTGSTPMRLGALRRLQSADSSLGRDLPRYDGAALLREMDLLPEWFLGRHLGLVLTAGGTPDAARVVRHAGAERAGTARHAGASRLSFEKSAADVGQQSGHSGFSRCGVGSGDL